MPRLSWALTALLLLTSLLAAEDRPAAEVRASFTIGRAVLTGTVEGLTEFLPVSSTGHMIITDHWLQVPAQKDVFVAGVSDRKGRPVSLKRVADDYLVIIQIGAIAAVLVAFWGRLSGLVTGLIRGEAAARRLAGVIVLACLPAALLGLGFKEVIELHLFSLEVVGGALIIGGVVILFAERQLAPLPAQPGEIAALSARQALLIGGCQCVALIPGTSRSLATILGGRIAGLSNAAATEFSFLIGLALLSAASLYKIWALGPALPQVYPAGPALLGLILAALTAFLAVKWMVGFVSQRGLGVFAWYRIGLGTVILVWAARP